MSGTSREAATKLGIFGGSFDPIHLGHLLIAESAREALGLSKVLFVPAAISPLKLEKTPRADEKQRLQMVKLAIGGNEFFEVDDREIIRGGTSFTVETLRELKAENPARELVLILGADSLRSFHLWHQPQEICQLATVVVLARGGEEAPDARLLRPYLPELSEEQLSTRIVPTPQIEISSSDLRQRYAAARSVRYQLPPAVEAYIASENLYRSNSGRP